MENSNFTTDQSSSQVLPAGYELDEYVIEQEIGAGGFGITYKAYDKQLDRYVAIKEYFPFNLASRDEGMHVSPKTRVAQDVDEYQWGLSRFIQEARTLALFEHPSIIRVIRYIERNSTAYIIMDFAVGRDVSEVLRRDGLLSVEQLKGILLPIAEGLAAVHSADMLHRDIKPGNIRLRDNGTAVLIDFGAARQAIGVRSQSISTILTPGYAPIEQYSTRGNQGPWTDIYALAAVGYVCLTGENLSHYEATERIRNDQLPKLVDRIKSIDKAFLHALDWALSPEESDRPQTVSEWLEVIRGGVLPTLDSSSVDDQATVRLSSPAVDESVDKRGKNSKNTNNRGEKKSFHWGMVAVTFGVVVGFVMFFMASGLDKSESDHRIVKNAPDNAVSHDEGVAENRTEPSEPDPSAVRARVVDSKPRAPAAASKDSVQDDRDFETAKQINTTEAFEIYLRLHPDGRHREKISATRQ